MADVKDPKAPHGYDDNGVPNAPYGWKTNGDPRISRRGAQAGQRGNSNKSASKTAPTRKSNTDAKRKEMLVGLADMLLVTPLAGLSTSQILAKRFGERQTDALAGDAMIISHFAPAAADGLIVLGETKPAAIAWLDQVEEKAPYLMLAQVGIQMAKAFIGNHLHPDSRLAEAGRTLATMKAAQMAQAVEEEAAAMGIPTEAPTVSAAV